MRSISVGLYLAPVDHLLRCSAETYIYIGCHDFTYALSIVDVINVKKVIKALINAFVTKK